MAGLPNSPWAERFAPSRQPIDVWDGLRHSGLAQAHPPLDPAHYFDVWGANIPTMYTHINKPPLNELDKIFHYERLQQLITRGVKTRQLGVLNTKTFLGRSGHTYENDYLGGTTFQINENKWLPCFKRHRWYAPQTFKGLPPSRPSIMNTDDDRVWRHLSYPLELFHKILRLLMKEQHSLLDAVLFAPIDIEEPPANGSIGPWVRRAMAPNESVPDIHGPPCRLFIRERPLEQRASTGEMAAQVMAAVDDVVCSFLTEEDAQQQTESDGMSTKFLGQDPTLPSTKMIMLAQFHIRAMVEGRASHAEACINYLSIAEVLFHEFMHVLWFKRTEGRNSDVVHREPFINDDPNCELGHASSAKLWGGVLRANYGYKTQADGAHHGLPLCLSLIEWEDKYEIHSYTQQDPLAVLPHVNLYYEEGDQEVTWFIPALWVSWVLTDEFWRQVIPIHGSRALRPPKTIGAMAEYRRGAYRIYRICALEPKYEIPELSGPLIELNKLMEEREIHNAKIRPWYALEYGKWQLTPWSWTSARQSIQEFSISHAKQDFRSAFHAASLLMHMALTAQDSPPRGDGKGTAPWTHWPTAWTFIYLAATMHAALPYISVPEVQQASPGKWFTPTLAAQAAHPGGSIPQERHQPVMRGIFTKSMKLMYTAPASNLVDPGEDNWVESAKETTRLFGLAQKIAFPTVWADAINDNFKAIEAFRQNPLKDKHFAPWNFEIPQYQGFTSWSVLNKDGAIGPYKGGDMTETLEGFYPSPRIYTVKHPNERHQGSKSAQLNPTVTASASGAPSNALRSRKKSPFLKHKYYTISEVADNGWIVDPNPKDGTTDVFDIEALLDVLDDETLQVDDLTTCGPLGRQLSLGQDEIRAALRDPRTRFGVGKLLPKYRLAEVHEHDGQDDAPSWVVHDDRIYDVTEYQDRNEKYSSWLSRCAGGVIFASTEDEHNCFAEVMTSIQKYQIGWILDEEPKAKPAPRISLRLITESMLRSYDNPTEGVYTVIGDNVYDLTKYIDNHPGGALAIQAVTGSDGTKAFLDNHDADLIDQPEFAALKIGRLVNERDPGFVDEDEIVLHDSIFNISGLYKHDRDLHRRLMKWYGTDATHLLTNGEGEDSKLRDDLTLLFLGRKDWIVAKIRTEKYVREVTSWDVRKHDESHPEAIWVVVDKDVFDVTPLVRHPDYYSGARDLTAVDAGRVITSSKTATWLHKHHNHRIVAKLVEQRHDSVSTIHLDEEGHDHEDQDERTDDRPAKKRKVHKDIREQLWEFVNRNKAALDEARHASSSCPGVSAM